jgi:regulatory protein
MLETGGATRLEQALAVAYRYLNRRDRTESEMRAHLEAKGVEPAIIGAALEVLADQGCVDDERYAQLFAHDKRELEHWGDERIRRTLRGRGVEREVIEAALSAQAPGDEIDRALDVLRRRFPEPMEHARERERALGVLLRKGYDTELALEAITRYGGSRGGDAC